MVIRSLFEDVELADGSQTAYVFANAGTWDDRPALIGRATGRAPMPRSIGKVASQDLSMEVPK